MISPVITSSLELSGVIMGVAMVTSVWVLKDIAKPFVGFSKKIAVRSKELPQQPTSLETVADPVGLDTDDSGGGNGDAPETEEQEMRNDSADSGDLGEALNDESLGDESSEVSGFGADGDEDDDSDAADETEERE